MEKVGGQEVKRAKPTKHTFVAKTNSFPWQSCTSSFWNTDSWMLDIYPVKLCYMFILSLFQRVHQQWWGFSFWWKKVWSKSNTNTNYSVLSCIQANCRHTQNAKNESNTERTTFLSVSSLSSWRQKKKSYSDLIL